MRPHSPIGIPIILALILALHGIGNAANLSLAAALTDDQLDKIAAGMGGPYASASGTGSATGASSQATVTLSSTASISSAGQLNAATVGQVSASATSNGGPIAIAHSTLSLIVNLP